MDSSPTSTESPPRVGFMSLAVECRIKIYEPLIAADEVCFFYPGFSYTGCSNLDCQNSRNPHALLFVNRTTHQEYMAELLRSGKFTFVLEYDILPGFHSTRELCYYPQLQPADKLPTLVYQYGRNITLHTSFGGKQKEHLRRMLVRLKSMENLSMTGAYTDRSKLAGFDEDLAPVLQLLRISARVKRVSLLFNFQNEVWVRARIGKGPKPIAWTGYGEVNHKYKSWKLSTRGWQETVQKIVGVMNGSDEKAKDRGETVVQKS